MAVVVNEVEVVPANEVAARRSKRKVAANKRPHRSTIFAAWLNTQMSRCERVWAH